MKIFLFAILTALLASCPGAGAAQADDSGLYAGEIPVADQSVSEQRRGMPLALEQVLQKLSGLRSFEGYPEVKPALRNASAMAITFYYRNRELTLADGTLGSELNLVVDFSRPAVDSLLQTLQLPSWKPERRALITWVIVDDGTGRRIMPIELEYARQAVAVAASARGMPLSWPQPDEAGNYPVDLQLLWGGYTEELVSNGPVDTLVMAARQEGPEWNVRMNLDYTGQKWTWRNRNADIQTALVEGMQTAIDDITGINSIAASDQGQKLMELTITGVLGTGDYVKVLSYLQSLSLIDHVQVSGAAPGKVRFVLTLNALPEYLVRALASDNVLSATAIADVYTLSP